MCTVCHTVTVLSNDDALFLAYSLANKFSLLYGLNSETDAKLTPSSE
jgi:hypothetical protein